MLSSYVRFERRGKEQNVALLTLRRVGKANAYNVAMLEQVAHSLDLVERDKGVRALVITGSGKHFCAGADLDELNRRDAEDGFELLSRSIFERVANSRVPTIAAVNGTAFAGGCELALACDLRLCSPGARFRLPELSLGLIPAAGGIRRLMNLAGLARTNELILFGRELNAHDAQAWGLVSCVVDNCVANGVAYAEKMFALDPVAVRTAKLVIRAIRNGDDGNVVEALAQGLLYERRSRGHRKLR